ncbi:MAG TPA: GAF domain-containing SpoIIE family protein phosphatase [Candidatus Binatia bacterium]|nr:GAF domain-containing SpoIIE family protein phosphatase [Candidatus Binatia bacterium]
MANALASTDTARQFRNLHTLLEVSKAMAREVQLDNLLQVIMEKTTEIMEADRSSLFLYDEARGELWSKIAQGLELKEIRFPIGVGLAGDVAKTRQVANIADAHQDRRFNPDFDRQTHYRTRSVLCLPLIGADGKLTGVIQVLNKKNAGVFDQEDEALLEALAAHAVVALERARLTAAYVEKQRMEEALKLAHEIQMSMLPKLFPPFPQHPEFDLSATIEPAREVGGDFYDFFLTADNHLCFAIGDVSGKGVPASLFMAVTKTLLKVIATRVRRPEAVLAELNNELYRDDETGMFVTIFYGVLNIRTGAVEYSNGGHNPPYLLSPQGTVIPLDNPGGMALGVRANAPYRAKRIQLRKGESLFLYTDGVTEAMDHAGNLFSERRLQDCLQQVSGAAPLELIRDAVSAVKRFASGAEQSDDITALAIRYHQG